jgi:signal transduction histidine kinase
MDALPFVISDPTGPGREDLLSLFPPMEPKAADSWPSLQEMGVGGWGIADLVPNLAPQEVLGVTAHETDGSAPWVLLRAVQEQGEWVFHPLSRGPGVRPDRITQVAVAPTEEGPRLELPGCMREVARARHDLNNLLTSGFAEVQLLFLDEPPPEVKEAVETIERQFRRLRDLVADLSRLRIAKSGPNPIAGCASGAAIDPHRRRPLLLPPFSQFAITGLLYSASGMGTLGKGDTGESKVPPGSLGCRDHLKRTTLEARKS